jgi:hypothetical protein
MIPTGLLFIGPWAARAGNSPEADLAFFESRIRPVLIEHCGECHLGGKAKGGLRMDSRTLLLGGGDSGTALVPGDPDASLLIRAVRYEDPDLRMPPRHRLPSSSVKDLEEWVRRGAPDPRAEPAAEGTAAAHGAVGDGRDHWAVQPLHPVPPPGGVAAGRGLDAFIHAKRSAAGLEAAPPADDRTWMRRVTLDLIGLPPTTEEVERFLADGRPDARTRWVDRLLSDPAYGERWARWWLDVARYADTNGQDENKVMANAWRYRDWVVRAFNADLSFDRFAMAQIAGDLLPADGVDERERMDRLIATGFLVLGPKLLAEQDKPKLVMDIIDEQVDTVGRAFLGLTLGCARCHDHKFDPVSQREYYALAGIFHGTRTMENLAFVSKFNERPVATADELAAIREQQELQKSPTPPPVVQALAVSEATVTNLPVMIRGSHLNPTKDPVPRGFPRWVGTLPVPAPGATGSGRLELAQWLVHPANPLTPRVLVNRVWAAHFGQGLVRSPENFGLRGDLPTHPELLDWLAARFVSGGWSLKALHREIVLSATYGQSAVVDEAANARDPENRWLHRFPRQRLEAETLRDAVLAVSGQLDRRVGGTLVDWKNDEYVPGDEAPFRERRRTLYLPVVRDRGTDLMTAFDGANPSVSMPQRPSTVVAPQALFLMNSPVVLEAARRLGGQVAANSQPPDAGVDVLYRAVLGRAARESERERAVRLLADARLETLPGNERWAVLAQVLLCSNEFNHRE